MKLQDIDLKQFLPLWMQDDQTAMGFAYAIQRQLVKSIAQIQQASIYARIDDVSEDLLNELAWQFNIPEYSSILSIESKRYMVKNCMKMHSIRGTKAAIENIINNIFGNGHVEEWFEYEGGTAGYFKVYTSNAGTTDDMVGQFTRIIEQTQNARSWLETVIVESVVNMDNNFAGYGRTADFIYV